MLKVTECPTCGSAEIKAVCRNWHGVSKGQPYVVPRLRFYECPACGERMYDREAMRKIQAHRPSGTKPRTRSTSVG